MLRLLTTIIGISVFLFSSSCVIDNVFTDDYQPDSTGNNTDVDLSGVVLLKQSSPMIWGMHFSGDPEDIIIPGTKDTSEQCREAIVTWDSLKQIEPVVDSGTSSDTKRPFAPSGNGELYYYTNVKYTPFYQPKIIYEALLGTNIPADLLNPGKIYMKGNYKYVGDINRGVHVYDYTDPENPIHVAFLYLPGNIDIAIKNNTMYANSYSNFVALDISNPKKVKTHKVLRKAFPHVYKYGHPVIDSTGGMAVAWKTDTIVNCGNYIIMYDDVVFATNAEAGGVDTITTRSQTKDSFGQGGSMSRFEISSDWLYAVDNNYLNMFNITNEADPTDEGDIQVGWGLETIFKTDKALFIGANTGMYIYDLKNPAAPAFASNYSHITSCDPVVVEGDVAYVTLRSGSFCRRGANTLDIIDVSNLYKPQQIIAYDMINPHGLAVEDSLLYLCEGDSGLKVFSVANPKSLRLLSHKTGFHAFDVIADGSQITVIGNDGVWVFDASNSRELKQLSHTEADGDGFGGNNGGIEPWMPIVRMVD
ncbi:MAG: hypothetical protein HQK83_15355 [Fibrobacteria bacterium]|nr:hypothetical protein [Fibrobacteria bacterium]